MAVIPCSYRNNQGLLYPLDRGFIWVHKPPVHVRFDEIACINFSRSGGSTRSFDIEIELKREGAFTFSSIEKDEYARLFDFCTNKKLRIKNIGGATASSAKPLAEDDMIDSDADDDGHDAYLARVKREGRERDEDEESDEDFNPDKVSGSDGSVAEEFDSDASSSASGEGSDEDSSSEKKKKEKKQKKKHRDEESSKKKKKKEGRKGKKDKDPDKPKKPMTAYFLWFQEQRDKMKEKYPDLSFTDLAKKGGELWKELKDKSKWENEAKRLQEGYKKDMERYEAGGGDKTVPKKGDGTKKPSTKKTTSPSKSSSFKSKEFIDSTSSSESEKESKKKKKKNDDESEKESKKKKKKDDDESEEEKKSKKKESKKGKKKESSEEEEEEDEEEAVSTPDSDSD